MRGGEIFVPKLPSIKIIDIAKSLSNKVKFKIIGRRSGEKMHEVLCPVESSNETYEFKNYYIIIPTIKLPKRNDFYRIINKEKGKKVNKNFSYSSENNKFLSINEIKKIID